MVTSTSDIWADLAERKAAKRRADLDRLARQMADAHQPEGATEETGHGMRRPVTTAHTLDGELVEVHHARRTFGAWRPASVTVYRSETSDQRAARMDRDRAIFAAKRAEAAAADLEALAQSYADDVAQSRAHTWLTPPDADGCQHVVASAADRVAVVLSNMLDIDDAKDAFAEAAAAEYAKADVARAALQVAKDQRQDRKAARAAANRARRAAETPAEAEARKAKNRARMAAKRAAKRTA